MIRLASAGLLSVLLFLGAGCGTSVESGVTLADGTVLPVGAKKEAFIAALGQPLPSPPTQISRRAQNATPAGSSWLTWKKLHRDIGRSAGLSKSAPVVTTDERGASLSTQMGDPEGAGHELLYLVAVFNAEGRFVRHLWLDDPSVVQ